MMVKRLINKTMDAVVFSARKLRRIESGEDQKLLRFYRIAYVLCNGDSLPEIYFQDGRYWFKGILTDNLSSYTDRELRRMARGLIRRVVHKIEKETWSPFKARERDVEIIYGFLTPTEKLVADGKMRSMNSLWHKPDKSKFPYSEVIHA